VSRDALASSGELLERDEPLAALDELLGGVGGGADGRLVWVGGEAGVGKTALLRTFRGRQERSARVLWGACESLLTPHPLGPVLDIAEACGGELGELVLSGARPYEVAAALVRELRRRAPTIVVLEDVHWADEATLDVLRLLGRRVGETRAVVLASFRDDELDRAVQLRLVVGDLGGSALRLKIAPLSAVAVADLSAPQGVDARELYRKTAGNPFLRDRGSGRPRRGDSGQRPRCGAGTGRAVLSSGGEVVGGGRDRAGPGRAVAARGDRRAAGSAAGGATSSRNAISSRASSSRRSADSTCGWRTCAQIG
jgi:hypothetical protein